MRVFILTGAGISAESGLGTFRDADGLWTKFDLNEVATPEGFARDPAKVHAFYNARRRNMARAQPNAAHFALARLEAALGDDLFLCTQNIDGLHEKGGSQRVVHMHGEIARIRCHACGMAAQAQELSLDLTCGACGREGTLRPSVVWFGEEPLHMEAIYEALLAADLFVAIGTSGEVYPAAGFVAEAQVAGVATCEINLAPSQNAYAFDDGRYGPATEAVPAWVDEMLNAHPAPSSRP